MVQRLYVNPKLIELVLDECSFCRRFYLYEKGIAYELECFLNTLLEKRDQKFIGGQIELLQRKIETLQFIKMILEVCQIPVARFKGFLGSDKRIGQVRQSKFFFKIAIRASCPGCYSSFTNFY